jgi:D-alanine-D-alanine ligase
VLPPTEAVFPEASPGYWPILSYDAKWKRGSVEYETTDYHFSAQMTPALAAKIEQAARRAFALLGCRDYARVDFRVRAGDDEPFVLEVNPNPDFTPNCALANNLWAAGVSHEDFSVQLVCNALARRDRAAPGRYKIPG